MLKSKKYKKYQFGGSIQNLIADFKPFAYAPFYVKKDTSAIGNVASQLQNIYEKRLESKESAIKAVNDLELNPMYSGLKKEMLSNLTTGIDKLKEKSNNNIISDTFSQGLLDLVGNVMNDTRLDTAKANTKAYETWQTNKNTLSEAGKYNPEFDPNINILEKMKKGEGLYNWWDVKTVTPYTDYNAYLVKMAQQVKERKDITKEQINQYDWWVTNLSGVPKDDIQKFLQAQKDGFLAGPEGQTFKLVVAKKYNMPTDNNGLPINSKEFDDKLTREYATLISGIANGIGYESTDDIKILTLDGAKAVDIAKTNAAKEKQSKEEEDKTFDLWEDHTPNTGIYGGTLPQYMYKSGLKSFDYKSEFANSYSEYNKAFKDFNDNNIGYEFKMSDGRALSSEDLLNAYESSNKTNEFANSIIVSSNGQPISDEKKKDIMQKLATLSYKRSLVKSSAAYINETDKDIQSNLLRVTEKGQIKYTLDNNYNETIDIGNNKKVQITQRIEKNGEVLWVVKDDDKGFKNKLMTPMEFKQLYNTLPANISENIGKTLVDFETKVTEQLKQKALDYSRKTNPDVQVLTEQLYVQYRNSDEYKKDLKQITDDVTKSGMGELYRDYMYQRTNTINTNNITTYVNDNYVKLPKTRDVEGFDNINSIVSAIENSPDERGYYMIRGDNDKKPIELSDWQMVKNSLDDAAYANTEWYRFFKDKNIVPATKLLLEGYDMNERLGGVYIGKAAILDSVIDGMLGSDTPDNKQYAEFRKNMNAAIQSGYISRDDNSKAWVFTNTTLLIPDNGVSYYYFKNKTDDQSLAETYLNTYNHIQDKINQGENIVVLPSAGNSNNVIRRQPGGTYSIQYTDNEGILNTVDGKTLEEVVNIHNLYNSIAVSYQSNFKNNPNVNISSNSTTVYNTKTSGVANKIMDQIVSTYVTDSLKYSENYKKAVKNDVTADKLNVTVTEPNVININYSPNNYPSKAILNILRQVACVKSIDSRGVPIHTDEYNALSPEDKQDLSDNILSTAIDIGNPAQVSMLQKLFGTSNLNIQYPDNGNTNSIVIKILE